MRQTKNSRLFYFLLVMGSMNFGGRGSIVLLILCLYEVFRRKCHLEVDGNSFVIACFCICVALAGARYFSYAETIKAANYLLMYLLGLDIHRRAEDKERAVEQTILAICTGFGFELILMYFYNVNREQLSVRSMYSIWTGETISVTLLGMLVSVVIGFSFYSIFYAKSRLQKIFVLFMLVIGLAISANTATRTPFILLFVVFVIMMVVHLLNSRSTRVLRLVLLIGMCLVLVCALYKADVGGMQTAILEMPIFQRFLKEKFESSRMSISLQHLALMMDYPWGGACIQNAVGMGAHNYLQEGYDLYGVFAFVFLLAITMQFISNIKKLLIRKYKTGIEILFLSMYFSILIQMCLEPIFSGYPILLWCLFMIHGMTTAYLKGI